MSAVDVGFRRHVVRDVTSGGRETAFQSIEKRFRADLRRRLRHLRSQVEDSRGRKPHRESGSPRPVDMPTIAVRAKPGAWAMPRPTRPRSDSYQSVTSASYISPSPRISSSSVPPSYRRPTSGFADSDDPMTSPEVAGSHDSSASDLFGATADCDRAKLTTGSDVIADDSKLDNAQRIFNTLAYGNDEKRIGTSSQNRKYEGASQIAPRVARIERMVGPTRRYGNRSTVLPQRSWVTLEQSRRTRSVEDRSETPRISALDQLAIELVPTPTLSNSRTGNSLEERRATIIDNSVGGREKTGGSDDVSIPRGLQFR